MQTLKNWILAALVSIAFLVICAVDDGAEDKQRASDDLQAAQTQARLDAAETKQELKVRAAYVGNFLALDQSK